MKPIKRISIVGIGLIGGSLALALKQRDPRLTIIGYDRTPILRKALQRGVVDEAATDLLSAVIQPDCLIFATPNSTTVDLLRSVGRFISSKTLVSDVCSVKLPILSALKKYLAPGTLFIGGHPMAGSENSGIDAADPLLFENAYYILCAPTKSKKREFKSFVKLIESTGARVVFLDAALHDRIVATVSHVPQLVAVALMKTLGTGKSQVSLRLAAGGFRDLTRVASSPYELWEDILRSNKKEVSRSLQQLISELQRYKKHIRAGNIEKIGPSFARAKKQRDVIPRDMKGFHRSLVDVFVSVEDKPGALNKMTRALSRRRINIKDIELLKVREGEKGTFRLSFETEKVASAARKALKTAGYKSAKP